MAGQRGQLQDQRRPDEGSSKNHRATGGPPVTKPTPRATSSRREHPPSPSPPRKRPPPAHSPVRSRERKLPRRDSRSPHRHQHGDHHQRGRELIRRRSSSTSKVQRKSLPYHQARRDSRSAERRPRRDRRSDTPRSRGRSSSLRPGRDTDTGPLSALEVSRRRRRSPRRLSPDTYIPSSRRRSRSPVGSTYRPAEERPRRRSRSTDRTYRPRRHSSPEGRRHHRRRSRSPPSRPSVRRPSPRRSRREADTYAPASVRYRRSPTPPRRRSPPPGDLFARRPRSRSPLPRQRRREGTPKREREREREREGEKNMRPSYPHGAGRGGPRPPPIDPNSYAGTPQHYAGGYPQSPYSAGRGWGAPSPYPPSHHGSPYPPAPYRQPSYPPPPSPGYFPPPPPNYYGGSPPYPSHGYPPPGDRRVSAGHSPIGRGDPKRRGHFSNLSWTPTTGSRGGVQLPPRDRKLSKDREKTEKAEEDEDDPFRPSKDLRAEDEFRRADELSPKGEDESKFRFELKGKPLASKNSTSAFERPKREKRLVKRIKPRPTLPPDFAASESVYYRKPGNESVVGSGTYGKVFRAVHVYTGEKVALKKIRMEGERDGFPVTAIREVKLLQSLNNDNVVKLQEVMVEKNDCYMVFEYLSHDLTGLLNHPSFRLDNAHKKHLARQLFDGLDYLHRRGVLHRDIKAANILISNTGQLKLADFGLARFFAKRRQLDYTNRVITIWYRSPELLLGETQYGPAVDIWSAACVLVEIFTKHAIFPGDGGEINQLDKIYAVLGTPTRTEWPGIVDMAWFELLRPTDRKTSTFADKYRDRVTPAAFELLTQMFLFDPSKRPSAEEVLKHGYFMEEEPAPKRAVELQELEGDWHEFESKALRKEKERRDREERRAKEHEFKEQEREKRKKAEMEPSSSSVGTEESRSVKRQRTEDDVSMNTNGTT